MSGPRRLFASRAQLEADEERAMAAVPGATTVTELCDRRRAVVCGMLRSVTLRPRQGVPALEAELSDGTGSLDLVWLGRREIAGIEPGRRMVVEGMVATSEGRRVMFNPRYELRPVADD